MPDILFRMLLGHLVGDYILQNNYMALNKKTSTFAGIVHCLIWSCSVILFMPEIWGKLHILFLPIFLSHYVLDTSSFVDSFLDMIGGRSYKSAEAYCAREDIPEFKKAYMRSYTAIVQTVADNTLHLVMLYGIFKFYGVV